MIHPELTKHSKAPIQLLSFVLSVTALVVLYLTWQVWSSYMDTKRMMELSTGVLNARSQIIYLDEVLTQSARLAALTGDTSWEDRYLNHEPLLTKAINDAIAYYPDNQETKNLSNVDQANLKLVDLETQSFELVRGGRAEQAQAILFGNNYQELKDVYARGMNEFTDFLSSESRNNIEMQRQRSVKVLMLLCVFVPIAVACWIVVIRFIQMKIAQDIERERQTIASKSKFVSMVSHELRTPLTAIKESIGIIASEDAGPLNQDQKNFADSVRRNVDRLSRLINNALDFQKLDLEKEVAHLSQCSINEIAKKFKKPMNM